MSAKRKPLRSRLFVLDQAQDKATKWVFKQLVKVSHVISENIETYFPGLTYPKDDLSEEGIGAFLGVMFFKLQIGTSKIGWGKDKPCSMHDLAHKANYSDRHFFRIQAVFVQREEITSDHDKKGAPAQREFTPKFWSRVKPLLKEHLGEVPKDVKDQEKIGHWIQQLIQKGRDYLAALERARQRAEDKNTPPANPELQRAQMRTVREVLSKHLISRGRGGGDPAPAV